MKYYKTIEISDTGSVFAHVYREDGVRVGFNYWSSNFLEFITSRTGGLENRCVTAHKWAEAYIGICKKHEVFKEEV